MDENSAEHSFNGYEPYFGLAESPFTLTSNPRFLYESESYRAAFKEIDYAISRREQIIVVTGPIGTGKTTLCRMIGERRGPRTVVAIVSTPPQTVDDLFRQILDGFGLLTDDTRSVVEASRYGLMKVLQQFLDSLAALKAQAILVVDEAQHLRPDVLEEIRLLLNLDTDRQLLQIVLVGQPELDDVLARTELGQMQQRVSRRHRLEPLQLAEVPAYVDRRLHAAQIAERASDLPTFTDAAMHAITALSGGVPRVVNILCDRALEVTWSEHTHTVETPAVLLAAKSLNLDVPPEFAPQPVATSAAPPLAPAAAAGFPSGLAHAPVPSPPSASPFDSVPFATPSRVGSRPAQSKPEPAALSKHTSLRVKRSQVPFAVAGAIAGVAVLAWILRGGLFGPPKPASQPGAVREATRPVPADRASSRPPAPAAPAAATKPMTSSLDASSTGEFMIVVSSFKTRDRSNRVAADILALGMPAFVRTSSGWEQVVVGPYPSRQDALAAQAKLEAAHFADTKVTQGAP